MLSNEMRTQKWVEEFKQCQNIKTLDRKVAVMLLNRIVVYSSDRIEIHFNNEDEIKELVEYALEHEDEIQGKVEVV